MSFVHHLQHIRRRGEEVKSETSAYKCGSCDFRLSKKLLFRELPPEDVKKMLSGPEKETGLIQGFISKRGRPFAAHLYFDEKGSLKWKFPPRPAKKKAAKKTAAKKKTTKKKTTKKKATKKKATKKAASKKKAEKKDGES